MFGLSITELIIIIGAIIIFIKPNDFPTIIYTIGKYYGKIKRGLSIMMADIETIALKEEQNKHDKNSH